MMTTFIMLQLRARIRLFLYFPASPFTGIAIRRHADGRTQLPGEGKSPGVLAGNMRG
jgi:hypothetical protein